MIPDEEIKTQWAKNRPYQTWLKNQRIDLEDLPFQAQPLGTRANIGVRGFRSREYVSALARVDWLSA